MRSTTCSTPRSAGLASIRSGSPTRPRSGRRRATDRRLDDRSASSPYDHAEVRATTTDNDHPGPPRGHGAGVLAHASGTRGPREGDVPGDGRIGRDPAGGVRVDPEAVRLRQTGAGAVPDLHGAPVSGRHGPVDHPQPPGDRTHPPELAFHRRTGAHRHHPSPSCSGFCSGWSPPSTGAAGGTPSRCWPPPSASPCPTSGSA